MKLFLADDIELTPRAGSAGLLKVNYLTIRVVDAGSSKEDIQEGERGIR